MGYTSKLGLPQLHPLFLTIFGTGLLPSGRSLYTQDRMYREHFPHYPAICQEGVYTYGGVQLCQCLLLQTFFQHIVQSFALYTGRQQTHATEMFDQQLGAANGLCLLLVVFIFIGFTSEMKTPGSGKKWVFFFSPYASKGKMLTLFYLKGELAIVPDSSTGCSASMEHNGAFCISDSTLEASLGLKGFL